MQDVIFAGSQKRKQASMSEVTVVLTNENGLLPVEYHEVAITRRLYRDGESEYLINNQQVRLKDIVELLAHTGVGKEAFAVIGQGKVSEIISQSPHDRRVLFEEVAGISHFLIKRKESERKLELAKANVSRAKDITQEVEAQMKTLEKQAIEAKRFQEQRLKLACFERMLTESRFDECKKASQRLSAQAKASSDQLKNAQDKDAKLKLEQQKKKEALKECQKAYSELVDAEHALERSIQAIKKDIDFCEEKKNTLSSQEKESTSQLSTFEERIKSLTSQKEQLEKELAKKEQELSGYKEQKETTFAEWQKVHQEQEELENSLKDFYSKRFSLQSRMQACESDLKKSQLAEEVAQEKVKERLQQKEKFETQKKEALKEAEAKKQELNEAVQAVEKRKSELQEQAATLKDITRQLDEQRERGTKIKQELYEKSARCKALSQLADHMEGYTGGAKALLQEAKKPASLLYGKIVPLADAVTLDHELLGRLYDGCLLVATKEDLQLALSISEQQKSQDASFVCLEMIGVKEAKDLKSHFLQKITGETWLENKYYIDGFGVLHAAKAKGENLFSRSKEIKSLQESIDSLSQVFSEIEEKCKALDATRQKLQQDLQRQEQEMRKQDMQVVSINFQLQASSKKCEEIDRDVLRQDSDMANLNELTTKLKEQLATKDKELQQAKKDLEQLELEFAACEKKAAGIRSQSSTVNERKQKAFFRHEDCLKAVEKDRHQLELLAVQRKELTSRLEQEEKLQKTIKQERASLDGKKKDTASQLEQRQEELQKLKEALVRQKETQNALELETKAIDQQLEDIQAKKEAFIKASSSEQADLEHIQEQLISYDTALRQPPPDGYKDFVASYTGETPKEEDVVRLKNAVERLRNVNLLAVEEHEAACERHALLVSQLKDLEQAERELIEIVGELEKESTKAFSKTFEEVKVAFKKHFQTLFQGGEADLVLCDEGAGVDIMAKPPGKQMRSMQLLSGGEKTLTALALLFACFDVRPSPFCILDEVDAPLDETNVERLGNLLKHFCDRTQFLLITHNKKTMQIADTLIGVSMAEKGVSQIIALDFRRRESPAGYCEVLH